MTQRTHTETALTAPEDKRSFLLFYEIAEDVQMLEREEIGDLFLAILSIGGVCEMPELNRTTMAVFRPIRRAIKENDRKWQEMKKMRAENGRKGGLQRAKNERKRTEGKAPLSKPKQIKLLLLL